MPLVSQKMPVRDPLIEPDSGLITRVWQKFLRERGEQADATPRRIGGVHLEPGQKADIPATSLPVVVHGGFYRVSVYARRTKLNGATASELFVRIGWREGAPDAQTLEAKIGNTDNNVTAVILGSLLIKCDPDTAITYLVDYDSTAAGLMEYSLDIVVEQVQA